MTSGIRLASTLDELLRDGLLQRLGDRFQTTRRWREERHRASSAREPASARNELHNPIVQALLAFYGGLRAIGTLDRHVVVLFALESSKRVTRAN
jgi:hypothetical protein